MDQSTLRKRFRNTIWAFPFVRLRSRSGGLGSGSSLQVLALLRRAVGFTLRSLTRSGLNFVKAASPRFSSFVTFAALGYASIPNAFPQAIPIKVENNPTARMITVTAGGRPFTTFIYPDSLAKPVCYPIYAADGQLITRGFPLAPRAGEPVDHPHHLGLWFNYENVNGLDFWNNSYAIPAEKKNKYGWIRTDSILEAGNGDPATALSHYPNTNVANPTHTGRAHPSHAGNGKVADNAGVIRYAARWTDQQQNTLLTEHTTLVFTASGEERTITRLTTLTAVKDVSFPDAKDGMLGLRVTKELQIPSNAPSEFVDDKGNITKVTAGNTPDINGTYLTSEGKKGDSAWGTRGTWCMLYGRKGPDTLSVVILDNPANPGYPTYWHARGYGLFAANPLGQKIFSNGKETMNFHLSPGQSVTFRYRIIIAAGNRPLSTGRIKALAGEFARIR